MSDSGNFHWVSAAPADDYYYYGDRAAAVETGIRRADFCQA